LSSKIRNFGGSKQPWGVRRSVVRRRNYHYCHREILMYKVEYNTKLLREKTKAENKETRQRSVRRLLKRGPKKLVKRRNVRLKKHALRHSRTRKKYLNRLNMQGARPQRSRSQKYPKVVVVQRDVVYRWLMSLAWHP
jgi:hypothetical protein